MGKKTQDRKQTKFPIWEVQFHLSRLDCNLVFVFSWLGSTPTWSPPRRLGRTPCQTAINRYLLPGERYNNPAAFFCPIRDNVLVTLPRTTLQIRLVYKRHKIRRFSIKNQVLIIKKRKEKSCALKCETGLFFTDNFHSPRNRDIIFVL